MRIFFIYDTTYCQADEDDPKDAILYFFPTQTHGNQFYSLCCQIVGVAKFFRATFSSPSLIVLDQEKFALYWSGKYLFVLGGRPDIHGNVLKRQLRFLCGIFCFYHGSINNLMKTCSNDRKDFLIKMELAWSRYITLAQCFDNLLQLPVNALPLTLVKKHVEAIAKANHLLHMCQMSSSVIAGAVFCNNRVLSSQLTPELSSYLTLMSNENAASPVRNVKTSNILPPDVELKYVYLSLKVVQGIVRYNHVHAGSSVRVKTAEKLPRSHCHYESLSSGSEGDIDSGNCTEICHHKKERIESNEKKIKQPCLELHFRAQLLCCSLHSTAFKKDLLNSQNETFLRYINSEFISEKLKIFKKKTSANLNVSAKKKWNQKMKKEVKDNGQVPSFNLPCYHHAGVFSGDFISKSASKHQDLSSTCDLEYSCYYCINHQFANHVSSIYLKRWNSDMHIPGYLHNIPLKSSVLECNFTKHKFKKAKASKCRIQVLKCRVKNNHCTHHEAQELHSDHVKKPTYENILFDLKNKISKHQIYRVPQNVCDIERYWENMENNKLEKNILYVQRCGANMLLLLLNRNYDESIFTYLWNCGFTFLQDLNYETDKKVEEGNEMDPIHYILMYDNGQKVLKEHPQYPSSTFSEKHLREAVQNIQEDFQSNSKLHLVSLLSTSQSIYACQAKQQSAFYLQQDQNSRKPESMCNLSKKAIRRLERYVKFST